MITSYNNTFTTSLWLGFWGRADFADCFGAQIITLLSIVSHSFA